MSQKNVEVLKRQTEAFNRRDAAAIQSLWHPDGTYVASTAAIEDTVYMGRDPGSYITAVDDLFEAWTVTDARYHVVDDRRVLQLHRVTAKARGSGVPIDHQFGIVWTFRDGLICAGESFSSPPDALTAVGLSEQDAHGG